MARSKTPSPSHKLDSNEEAHNRAHPLRRQNTMADAILDVQKKRQAQEELIIERVEEWKKLLNRLAASKDGQTFFTYMLKANNLFTPGVSRDTVRAVEDKQRQDFYLRHVRPYLDKSIRAEFE